MTHSQSDVAIVIRTQNNKKNFIRLYDLFLSTGITTIPYDEGPLILIDKGDTDISILKDAKVLERIITSIDKYGTLIEHSSSVIIVTDEVSTLSDPEGINYFLSTLSYYQEWDIASLVRIRNVCSDDTLISSSYPNVIRVKEGTVMSAFILRHKALNYLRSNNGNLDDAISEGILVLYTTNPELFTFSIPSGDLLRSQRELSKMQRCINKAVVINSSPGQLSYLGIIIILFLLVICSTRVSRILRWKGQ